MLNCYYTVIARRGKRGTILSDNGTNFVGVAKEMRDCINAWIQSDIEKSLAQKTSSGNSTLLDLHILEESGNGWFEAVKKQ